MRSFTIQPPRTTPLEHSLPLGKTFWGTPLGEIFSSLKTTEEGLSQREALDRLKREGANELTPPRASWFFDFLSRFKNPIILLLLAICSVAFFWAKFMIA